MDSDTRNRLLQSIESNRLAVICGAGLSMADESQLPSAADLAAVCHREYRNIDPDFDPNLSNDLGGIAKYFHDRDELTTYFIPTLVPWSRLVSVPNNGHKALADFLVCKAIFVVISSNYDDLIEISARDNGADLQVALDGADANAMMAEQSPFLKIHGCMNRDRLNTVWVNSQLSEDPISNRVESNTRWMVANLVRKDLLIIGYWSDWAYLNSILVTAFADVVPTSVTLINPGSREELESKAPELWDITQKEGIHFYHVNQSGSEFLDELRIEYSKMYLRKLLSFGDDELIRKYRVEIEEEWKQMPDMSSDAYYKWRKDAEGMGMKQAAREKSPRRDDVLGYAHLLFRKEGATIEEEGYRFRDQIIRLVNGSGRFLGEIKEKFLEAPVSEHEDLIVCVSAHDSGLKENIAREGEQGSFMRPKSIAEFLTFDDAIERLGI